MLDVKHAVNVAVAYVKNLFEGATDIRLEEVELSDDERFWTVTLSAQIPGPRGPFFSPISELFPKEDSRVYKSITINADSGAVKAMKIRTLA